MSDTPDLTTQQVIDLARSHIPDPEHLTSAVLCYRDAVKLESRGLHTAARSRAIKSLRYSVGIHHPDYQLVDPTGMYHPMHEEGRE